MSLSLDAKVADSQLVFYMTLALYVGLRVYERWNAHADAVKEHLGDLREQQILQDREAALAVQLLSAAAGGATKESKGALTSSSASAASSKAKKDRKELTARAQQAEARLRRDARCLGPRERTVWLVLLGLSCGAALSVKWTALVTPGILAIEALFAFFFLKDVMALSDGFVVLGAFIVEYSLWFWIHFQLLWKSSDGDAFMSVDFQRTLWNNTHYDPNADRPPFHRMLWELNAEMLRANARIDTPHHWMSKWWTWPLNQRGVLYYSGHVGPDPTKVYLLGNPAVSWLVLGGFVFTFVVIAAVLRYRFDAMTVLDSRLKAFVRAAGFCTSAYVLGLLPYIAVSRAAFIYHYIPSLLYGIVITALTIDVVGGRSAKAIVAVLSAGVVVTWVYFAPWVYALPLSHDQHKAREWLAGWN